MKIREFYSDESKWCKDYLAKDYKGNPVNHDSPRAISRCLLSAMWFCYGDNYGKIASMLVDAVGTIPIWNNKSTFKEVKELVERLDI